MKQPKHQIALPRLRRAVPSFVVTARGRNIVKATGEMSILREKRREGVSILLAGARPLGLRCELRV